MLKPRARPSAVVGRPHYQLVVQQLVEGLAQQLGTQAGAVGADDDYPARARPEGFAKGLRHALPERANGGLHAPGQAGPLGPGLARVGPRPMIREISSVDRGAEIVPWKTKGQKDGPRRRRNDLLRPAATITRSDAYRFTDRSGTAPHRSSWMSRDDPS